LAQEPSDRPSGEDVLKQLDQIMPSIMKDFDFTSLDEKNSIN
jgi:hypothetical protein